MSKKILNLPKLQFQLWEESCKAKALGEMLIWQNRETSLDEEQVWTGYGLLIRNVGERLDRFSRRIEVES